MSSGSRKPLRCRLGRHTGQADGGTLMYTCPRCHGSFWQTRDYSHLSRIGDQMIAQGRGEEAIDYVQAEIRKDNA